MTPPEGTGATTQPTPATPAPPSATEEEPPPLPAPPKPPGPPLPPRNPFGFGDPAGDGTATPGTGTGPSILRPGSSSSFGPFTPTRPDGTQPAEGTGEQSGQSGQGGRTPSSEEGTTFNAPGFFGAGQQTFNSRQGRFAKPRYRYGVSMSMGFDDNYNQTPDRSTATDSFRFTQTIPAQEEVSVVTFRPQVVQRPGVLPGTFITTVVNVPTKVILQPATPERDVVTVIPGFPETPRASSIISTLDGYFSTQWLRAREALTFDLSLGAEYYFDKKDDPIAYNGSLSLLYVRKLTPRMQLSANAAISHQSQPDASQVNVSTQQSGEYTNGRVKLDLSYRWSPRFSTNTSLASQMVYYDSTGANASNSFYDLTLSNEFRYIWSPRTTYVVEVRGSTTKYIEDELRNTDSVYLLLGVDQRWSRRLNTTLRLGQTTQTIEQGDTGAQSSPYGELSLSYLPSSRSQLSLTARYGFEATNSANEENVTLRTSLNYSQAITFRLSGSVGLTYVDSQVTSGEGAAETTFSNQTFDGNVGLSYRFNRHFSMSARYSYTMLKTNLGFSDYDRGRFFLTATYDF